MVWYYFLSVGVQEIILFARMLLIWGRVAVLMGFLSMVVVMIVMGFLPMVVVTIVMIF